MKRITLSSIAAICLAVFCLPMILCAADLVPLKASDGLDVKIKVEPRLKIDVDRDFVEMTAVATSSKPVWGPTAAVNIDANINFDLFIEGTKAKNEAGAELKGYGLMYGRSTLKPIPELPTLIPPGDISSDPWMGAKAYYHAYGHQKLSYNRLDEAGWYQSRVTFTAIEKF